MKMIYLVAMIAVWGVSGCFSSNENVGASSTIKVIREPKYAATQEKQGLRQIQTGKIEVVEYNSSVISPEKEGYVEPKAQTTNENSYENRVDDKVSSAKDNAQRRADTKVDRSIDNVLGRIFN